MYRWLGLLAILVAVAAQPRPAEAVRTPVEFRYAYAHRDCAPWDGPAIRIVMQNALIPVTPKGKLPPARYPHFSASLWTWKPPVGRWIALRGNAPDNRAGTIVECPAGGTCQARTGRIRLDKRTETHIRGELRIQVPDSGEELVIPFDAPILRFQAFCG